MSARARRQGAAAVIAAAVAAATLALAAPSTAASAAGADDCDGVWVVVDATALGGDVTTRCAPGDPPDGLAALTAAGFSYAFVPNRPGFVCTIDGRPDPCNGAPTDAYWSYWHAPAEGSWSYSQRGAGNRDPAPGSVDGWAFGDGAPPSVPPPAPKPEPEPESRPSPERDDAAAPRSRSNGGSGGGGDDGGRDADGSSGADGRAPGRDSDDGDTGDGETGNGHTDSGDRAQGDGDHQAQAMDVPPEARQIGELPRRPPPAAMLPSPDENGGISRNEAGAAADPVELPAGGGWTGAGTLAGGTLVAGLAVAAVLRSRRRAAEGA